MWPSLDRQQTGFKEKKEVAHKRVPTEYILLEPKFLAELYIGA